MRVVRARVAVLVLALGLAAAVAVVAAAQTSNGLPAYTKGYAAWPKLNRKPVTGGSAAHGGVKNTYASKPRAGRAFPEGTVIVKTIARSAAGKPYQVAVMRKVKGMWRWVEYQLAGARYERLGVPASVCTGCHVGAKARDWVFTGR